MFEALSQDPTMLLETVVALAATGCIAGLFAGLFGVGGGAVIVPVLFFFLPLLGVSPEVVMHVAVGTSLACIIPTSISSIRSHYKHGAIDLDLQKQWGLWIVVGVVAGTVFASAVRGPTLTGIFGFVILGISLNMLLRGKVAPRWSDLPGYPMKAVWPFIIGSISVMVGIGGGSLSVPIMTAHSIAMRNAVANASAFGFVIALPGAIGFLVSGIGVEGTPPGTLGYVNLLGVLCIVPLSTVLAPVGARLAHRMDPVKLKRFFAVFLLFVSIKMLYSLL